MIARRPFSRWAWLSVLVVLAACAQPQDIPESGTDATRALTDAAAVATPGRLPPSLAGTPFGREVAEAVQTYPGITAGAARLRAARAAVEGQRSAFMPQIGLGAEAGVSLTGGASTSSGPVLRITQLVYDGGIAAQRTEAARARVAETQNDRLTQAATMTLQAVEAWHNVLHRRRLLELSNRNLSIHQEFLSQIEARFGAGAGAETDLLTARSRLADARARQVAAQGQLDRAEAQFRQFFGRAPGQLATVPAPPALPAGDSTTHSPRLRGLNAAITAAQAEVEAARAARWPSLVLGLTGRETAGQADVRANLELRYELTTGGRREAALRSAEARVAELEAQRDDLVREIGRALDFVRSDQRVGAARLTAARAARRANEANVDATREQFSIGRRSITELLDAQRDFITASETVLQAELELSVSGYAALALTGDLLDVFGIRLPDQVVAAQ